MPVFSHRFSSPFFLRSTMIKKVGSFVIFSFLLAPTLVLAKQSSEPTLAERSEALCDQSVQTARIDWEEAGHLSQEEFEETLPTSRAAAVVAGKSYEEMDRLLKREGTDSDAAAEMLRAAASFDMQEVVSWLLGKGVPIDGNGRSVPPLVAAGACGRHELVSELLARGADPNVYSGESTSAEPMVQAIVLSDRKLAEMLLAHGYDPCKTELADGRNLRDLLETHTQLDPGDPFWGQLVCRKAAR